MNFLVRFVVWLKRLFRGRNKKFQLWDVTAISRRLDKLKEVLQAQEDIVIIIPEVSLHQLGEYANKYKIASEAYEYILAYSGDKLRFEVCKTKTGKETVNEQVWEIVDKYVLSGYNVTIVTCNCDMLEQAIGKRVCCNLLGTKQESKISQVSDNLSPNEPKTKKQGRTVDMAQEKRVWDDPEDQKRVPYKRVGKDIYISAPPKLSVLDSRGKRRIGKNGKVMVKLFERIVYDQEEYIVREIHDDHIMVKHI